MRLIYHSTGSSNMDQVELESGIELHIAYVCLRIIGLRIKIPLVPPKWYTARKHFSVGNDDPNITMEEYVRLKTERVLRNGKVYNWETATYELSSEPTVSPQHVDEVNLDFEISFSEFDNEDYTFIYDNDSFSYKLISVNDLKSDMDNDVGIKRFLILFGITTVLIDVNAAQSKLYKVNAAEGVNVASEEVSTAELNCHRRGDILLGDCRASKKNSRTTRRKAYKGVPSPYTGNFMPPAHDLSFTGLDEFINKPVVENRKSDEEVSKVVRKSDDSLIIEDWVSDSEEENVS
ncbi:hypothetical protein Tco_1065966 [Tanacetum coccineum]